ncbi:hypothetical protein [Sphingomonas astaxanthinifaciens]|uniref:Uncharacterized protein n=1 Tax=Sphingomonas astaxanthinifaciens DSM 22298 TaxID=1123267 RepID=A0ABQ5Z7P8_9SPHN|nr:hypothetical protein [Sphingomonas astaxanthinifaciens]GLR48030.1 hypothetical protein GCM10007925_17430 [Sphingomonas astaxanthinifaciens DSM 22298]
MRTLAIIAAAGALTAVASPAAAQYYPQPTPQPYPGQPGYGYPGQIANPNQGTVAAIIGQLLGGRNYAASDQQAIAQCATAAQTEVARRYPSRYAQQGYDPRYGQQGYDPRYGQQGYGQQTYAGQARVTAISNVERRNRGLRVTGLIDSGMNGYGQPPYGNAYGYNQNRAYAQADLRFNCTVDYSGRISSLKLNRVR